MVGKPGMVQVWAYQHQLQVVYHFYIATYHPFCALGVDDKVQFILIVVVQRKIKFILHPGRYGKTIAGGERGYLTHYIVGHLKI
jgi:hypothetical protein